MSHNIDQSKQPYKSRNFYGRRVITTGARHIGSSNVISELRKALNTHDLNRSETDFLWRYYKGDQPILYRQKEIRPEICNRIVENRANEIVSFEVGYLCGEPIQYVSKSRDPKVVEQINKLDDMMFSEDKVSGDQELFEWQKICGVSYRLVLPDTQNEEDEAPFEIFTLDPRDTFVVYSNEIGNKPLMAVKCSLDENSLPRYSVYTSEKYYLIENDVIKEELPHALGTIPIFEYPANNARLGSFEKVITILDAINNVASNRLDGVEQVIQSFIKFINCDIEEKEYLEFLELGAIKIKSIDGQKADVGVVNVELNQDQSQTLKDDFYNSVLSICGIPNRNGSTSTSDTGAAALLKEGWTLAEARAKDAEHIFKKSEKKMLKLVLKICSELADFNIKLKDIDMKFTRRNYEAIQSKSQVLISMLQEPQIHPRLAFLHSGMFTNAEAAYTMSMEHYNALKEVEEKPVLKNSEGTQTNAKPEQAKKQNNRGN